ncbi:Ferric/cupric reductase transmembrane component [Drechslerella dactyloides]|uniref:Ferric/cupric reductase transmembrane component n=1 Tax=Drechslerella dactyloides TaxID=74499 RepID=A0AAD6NGI5_DREDA|nr:Ferric/cupric reductase transmembrane component [Drechslerella dactyloides]
MPSGETDNLFRTTNQDIAQKYWIIVGIFTAFLTSLNVIDRVLTRLRLRAAASNHPHPTRVKSTIGHLWAMLTALAREAALPSVRSFTNKNSLLSMFTPLPLGRSLVVLVYMVMVAIMLSFNVYVSGYWYYEKIAYRAAWVAVTQIPFVLLIGGRISVFTLLTRIASERINWLHRWVGRVILVSVIVHMALFLREWDLTDFLQTELEIMPMVRYGFGAFGVLLWIMLSSLAPVRWFAYEFFYLNHLASVGALLWCLYKHVPDAAAYNIYLGIAFVALDRVLRGLLWVYSNIWCSSTSTLRPSLRFGHTAEIEILDRKEHLTRVVVKDVTMKWRAGQHIYLSIPALRPFESHPFTISNICDSVPSSKGDHNEPGKIISKAGSRDLHLLIGSRAGFSKKLHQKCAPAESAPVLVKAFVEGPYGSPPVWKAFETVVLIATSTGITFILPILEEIAADAACVRRIRFYWTVRHVSDLKLLTKRLARLCAQARGNGVDVLVNIAVTCGTMKHAHGAIITEAGVSSHRNSSETTKESEDTYCKESEVGLTGVGNDEISMMSSEKQYASPPTASCCGNKQKLALPGPSENVAPVKTAQQPTRPQSGFASVSSSSSQSEDALCCCAAETENTCCETVCTCGFAANDITFSCGRSPVGQMVLPAVEAAQGETVVACCANRRLMDDEQAGLEAVSTLTLQEKLLAQLQHPSNDPTFSAPIPIATEGGELYYDSPPPSVHVDPSFSQYGQGNGGGGGEYSGHPQFASDPTALVPDRRILGLKRWVFFTILAVVLLVVVGAAVGGGVGGSLASKNNGSSASSSDSQTTSASSTTATSTSTSSVQVLATPGTFAAVKASTADQDDFQSISYLFQDINTPDIYLTTIKKGGSWAQIGKIQGLNPQPRPNSTIAAIQAPDEETISLYYVAENGTLYDAIGSSTDTIWRMGTLAPRTNYGVLVSQNSGIAATWWGTRGDSGPGYRLRIYYVDSAAARVRELAFNAEENPQWFVTREPLESCSPTAKISVAHLRPDNSSSTLRETAHLFYQNTNGDIRHYPGYDGRWNLNNAETISQSTIPTDAWLTSTIYTDKSSNYTLRLWYIDGGSRLNFIAGEGQSLKADPTFNNIGTFGNRQIVSGLSNAYISDGQVPGGPVAAVEWVENGEQLRLYFQASVAGNNNKNGAVEVAQVPDRGWVTKVNVVELP